MNRPLRWAAVGTFVFFAIVLLILAVTGNAQALLYAVALFVIPVVFWMLDLMWRYNPPQELPRKRVP